MINDVPSGPPTTTEIIRAIRKNGYRKTKGLFIRLKVSAKNKYTANELYEIKLGARLPKDKDDVYAACAMGQAALNLDIAPNYLHFHSASEVFKMNDDWGYSLEQIADQLDARLGISTK